METVVNEREELFGFDTSEIWNFAVYIYDDQPGRPVPVCRQKARNYPSKDASGRSWKPGTGHVGIAFAQREARITADASNPDLSLFGATGSNARDYDGRAYISFISQPIFRMTGEA